MVTLQYNNSSITKSADEQDTYIHTDPFNTEELNLLHPAVLMYPDRPADGAAANTSAVNISSNKVKRNRAKGETLNILERQFHLNPNPTPQERRQIAKLVNMNEKSVTIWFQNKRAKIKRCNRQKRVDQDQGSELHPINNTASNSIVDSTSNDKKRKFGKDDMGSNSDDSGVYKDKDFEQDLEEEDGQSDVAFKDGEEINFFDRIPLDININYYFIDVCSILVGSWNRIKSGSILNKKLTLLQNMRNLSPRSINEIMVNSTDLTVVISKKNFEVNYFFSAITNNCKVLFRIFYPIDNIVNCSISLNSDELISNNNNNNTTNNDICSELKLTLNKSPNFAVYFLNENVLDTTNQWSICEDFSEGKQVNDAFIGGSNLPHILKGLQDSLKFMNSLILDYKATNQVISPSSPLPPPPPPQPIHSLSVSIPPPAMINPPSMDGSINKSILLQPHDLDIPISMDMAIPDALSFQSLSDSKSQSHFNIQNPQDQNQEHNNNILFNDNRNISYDTISSNNNNNNNNNSIRTTHNDINLLQYQDTMNTSSSAYSPNLQFHRNNLNIPYNPIHNQIDNGFYDNDNVISSSITNHIDNQKNNSDRNSKLNTNTSTIDTSLNPHDLDNINLTPSSFFFDHQDYLSNATNDQIYTPLHQSTLNYDNNSINNNVNMDKNNNLLDGTN